MNEALMSSSPKLTFCFIVSSKQQDFISWTMNGKTRQKTFQSPAPSNLHQRRRASPPGKVNWIDVKLDEICQEDDPVSLCLRIFSQELLEIGQLQSSQKKMAMCQWILYEMNSFLHILNLLLLCYAMNVSNVLCAAIVIVSCW